MSLTTENTKIKKHTWWSRVQEGLGISIAIFGAMLPVTILLYPVLTQSFEKATVIGIYLFLHTAAGAVAARVMSFDT